MTEASFRSVTWRKSSFSAQTDCVEVADLGSNSIAMRNSKRPEDGYVAFTRHEIDAFLRGIVAGEFDDLC
jgi:hypothetical protein